MAKRQPTRRIYTYKLDEQRRREIATRFGQGESCNALASEFGVSYSAVLEYAQKFGCSRPRLVNPARLSDEQKRELIGRYEVGESAGALCLAYNICGRTIRKYLRRAGVTIRITTLPPPPDISHVTMSQAAWAAGFFDGEGCIGISYSNPPSRREGGRSRQFALCVQIVNTHRATLEFLRDIFGFGRLYTRKPANPRCRSPHVWTVGSVMAGCFLRVIQPHSVTKAEQIRLALRFRELRCSDPFAPLPPEVLAEMDGIREQIRILNGRFRSEFKPALLNAGRSPHRTA